MEVDKVGGRDRKVGGRGRRGSRFKYIGRGRRAAGCHYWKSNK